MAANQDCVMVEKAADSVIEDRVEDSQVEMGCDSLSGSTQVLETTSEQVENIETKVGQVEAKVGQVEKTVESTSEQVDDIQTKVGKVEAAVESTSSHVQKIEDECKKRIENLMAQKLIIEKEIEHTDANLSSTWDLLSTKQSSIEMRLMYVDEEVAEAVRQITNCLEVFDHNLSMPEPQMC